MFPAGEDVSEMALDFITRSCIPTKHANAAMKMPASAPAVYCEASSRTMSPQRSVQTSGVEKRLKMKKEEEDADAEMRRGSGEGAEG